MYQPPVAPILCLWKDYIPWLITSWHQSTIKKKKKEKRTGLIKSGLTQVLIILKLSTNICFIFCYWQGGFSGDGNKIYFLFCLTFSNDCMCKGGRSCYACVLPCLPLSLTFVTILLSCLSHHRCPLEEAQCKTGDGLACRAPDSGDDRPPTCVCNGGGAVDTKPQPCVKCKGAFGILFLTLGK